jgi:choline dehydrogenase-like flavoprotein
MAGAVGAGFALPATAEAQHPMDLHLAKPSAIAQAQQKAAAGAYAPELLDAHQLKTLDALAEAIVPGSSSARVGRSSINCLPNDISNLYVMDASSFVSWGCQNPTLTIMALAVRGCDHLMEQMKKGSV